MGGLANRYFNLVRYGKKGLGDEDHYIDESQRLLVRPFQPTPFLRVPRIGGNEDQKVRSWRNSIRTSQYRWWNFLPLNLFQQMIIPSNTYFLVMALLQLIKPISDSGGIPTFLLPISVVMAVTMLKDAYEDIKRHHSDSLENNNVCQVMNPDGSLRDVKWRDLVPGDIVKVTAESQFPADLILISCSDAYGISYVGTVQLDGETNLKDKTCLPEMMEMFSEPTTLAQARMEILYGPPNAKIYAFDGTLRLYNPHFSLTIAGMSLAHSGLHQHSSTFQTFPPTPNQPTYKPSIPFHGSLLLTRRTVSEASEASRISARDVAFGTDPFVDFPININQFLWRGASLQNTDWIYGLVVYTGHNTRIFKNSKSRVLKYSKLLKTYNKHAIFLACTQFLLCLVAAIIYATNGVWFVRSWYLMPYNDSSVGSYETTGLAGFLNSLGIGFGRFVLLLSYFVPITLFVQLEVVKWCQAYFFLKDNDMHSPISGKCASVSTVSLMEELGSITHIFSDKTGTLTLNLMQLKCLGIGSCLYGFDDVDDPTFDPLIADERPTKATTIEDDEEELHKQDQAINVSIHLSDEQKVSLRQHRRCLNEFVDFDSWMILKHFAINENEGDRKRIRDFLLILALCHSVLPKKESIIEELNQVETMKPDSSLLSSSSSPQGSPSPPGSPHFHRSVDFQRDVAMLQSVASSLSQDLDVGNFQGLVEGRDGTGDQPIDLSSIGDTETDDNARSETQSHSQSEDLERSRISWTKDESNSAGESIVTNSYYRNQKNNFISENIQDQEFPLSHSVKHQTRKIGPWDRVDESILGESTSIKTEQENQQDIENPRRWFLRSLYQSVANHESPIPESEESKRTQGTESKIDGRKTQGQETVKSLGKIQSGIDGRRLKLVKWKRPSAVTFDASSPDELALVSGAMHLGLEFLRRPNLNTIQIALTNEIARKLILTNGMEELADRQREIAGITRYGDTYKSYDNTIDWLEVLDHMDDLKSQSQIVPSLLFDILEVLEFDNVRKKMSVIIRDFIGQLRLLTKGADSSMIACAHQHQKAYLMELKVQLDDLSRKGLRTLVFGHRPINEQLLKEFREKYNRARITGNEDAIIDAYNWIETELTLVGCTGIDDKLQPQVPQTIEAIRSAGIKLWVLTGDKLETAISIGHSCNVLTESTYNAILSGSSEVEIREQLHQYMTFIVAGQLAKDAFDQVLANQAPTEKDYGGEEEFVDEEEVQTKFKKCITRTLRPLGCLGPSGAARAGRKRRKAKQPLIMSWEDFVKAITFQAKNKPVVSQPQGTAPSQLTPEQVEALIDEYLRAFDVEGDYTKEDTATKATNQSTKSVGRNQTQKKTVHEFQGSDAIQSHSTVQNARDLDTELDKNQLPKIQEQRLHERVCDLSFTEDRYEDRYDIYTYTVPTLREYGERQWILDEREITPNNENNELIGKDQTITDWESVINPESPFNRPQQYRDVISNYYKNRTFPKFQLSANHGESQPSPQSRSLSMTSITKQSSSNLSSTEQDSITPLTKNKHGGREPGRESVMQVERFTAVAITCTGEALNYVMANDSIKRYFFGLANLCATVIACRVTPKQKAEIVREASRYLNGTVSLGIGDGANDVGMIITASVGVGICGKEGMQAARAADFAIGEFRLLRNLLFLHGHENLRRNALQVYHTVYKNVMFGVADWVYGFFSGFSAVDLYNTWLKQIYNLAYTPFPSFLFSIFDRMLPADIFLSCPWLYPIALRPDGQLYFGKRRFAAWLSYGLLSATVLVVFPLRIIGYVPIESNGRLSTDLATYGHSVFFLVVIAANFAVIPFYNTWFWFIAVGYVVCFACWYIAWGLCSSGAFLCSDLHGSFRLLDGSWLWQFMTVGISFIVLVLIASWWFYRVVFTPDPATIIRERIAKGVFDVVVAPRRMGGLAVVVPRRDAVGEQWRGFAFSEGMTRLQLHRRLSVIPKTVITQTAALGTLAGGLFYPSAPAGSDDGKDTDSIHRAQPISQHSSFHRSNE